MSKITKNKKQIENCGI